MAKEKTPLDFVLPRKLKPAQTYLIAAISVNIVFLMIYFLNKLIVQVILAEEKHDRVLISLQCSIIFASTFVQLIGLKLKDNRLIKRLYLFIGSSAVTGILRLVLNLNILVLLFGIVDIYANVLMAHCFKLRKKKPKTVRLGRKVKSFAFEMKSLKRSKRSKK